MGLAFAVVAGLVLGSSIVAGLAAGIGFTPDCSLPFAVDGTEPSGSADWLGFSDSFQILVYGRRRRPDRLRDPTHPTQFSRPGI